MSPDQVWDSTAQSPVDHNRPGYFNGHKIPYYLLGRPPLKSDLGAVSQGQNQNNPDALNRTPKYNLLKEEVFKVFVKEGEVVEVRLLKVWGKSPAWEGYAKNTVSGYFDNFDSFRDAVFKTIQSQQTNIYFTLQVIDPRLIGRAYNKLKPTDLTTSDDDVLYYRWIPIDLDVKRPSGISATDSELKKALEIRDIICDWIADTTEYQAPMTAVSGNGCHILIRLPKDLPVNEDSKEFVKSFLKNVHKLFSTDLVKVDTAVYNPARIWKLYGSKAMKGDEVPGNQYREALVYRESYIDDLGGVYEL